MSHRSLIWPLSVVMTAVLAITAALATPSPAPYVAPNLQGCQSGSAYYPVCATETAQAAAAPTSPPAVNTATPTATATRTVTASATIQAAPTPTASPRPTATALITSTPTATAPAEGALICEPGLPVRITGQGPPLAQLLLLFNDRVVGGTASDRQGFYQLLLVVGNEASGAYPITVTVRGTREVVQELECTVPARTPTPTPPFLF